MATKSAYAHSQLRRLFAFAGVFLRSGFPTVTNIILFSLGILRKLSSIRPAIGKFCVGAVALCSNAGVFAAEPSPPIIFIGTAFPDRLAELKDRRAWSTVAPRVGLFLHPLNLAKGSEPIFKEIAPLFGLRRAILERNRLPTEEDVITRLKSMRETYHFQDGLYFYFNGITSSSTLKALNESGVETPPSPEWFARAKTVAAQGGIPLFGPAPHVLYRAPGGWTNVHWDYLRDLSVFRGYCFDAPAEFYVRTGINEKQQAANELYRRSIVDSIQYARSHGGLSIYLFGSHLDAAQNIANAREVVRDLKKRNALPSAWGIEDYSKNSQLHMVPERNPDGSPANTVTGLALWIMEFYAGRAQ